MGRESDKCKSTNHDGDNDTDDDDDIDDDDDDMDDESVCTTEIKKTRLWSLIRIVWKKIIKLNFLVVKTTSTENK